MQSILGHIADGFQSFLRIGTRASRATYGATFAVWIVIFGLIPEAQAEGTLATLIGLAVMVLFVPLWARRMHDIGRSGWWLLLFWWVWVVLLFFFRSNPKPNRWGPPAGTLAQPLEAAR